MATLPTHRLENPQQFGPSIKHFSCSSRLVGQRDGLLGIPDILAASISKALYDVLDMFSRTLSGNVVSHAEEAPVFPVLLMATSPRDEAVETNKT
jgi:hypothetical protein